MAPLHLQQCFLLLLSFLAVLGTRPVTAAPMATETAAPSTAATTQQQEECPTPLCVDSVFDGTCRRCTERSQCRYQGCVTFGHQYGPVWRPDNCTTCHCERYWPHCYTETCQPSLECFGYPKVKHPGQCCPRCEFGVKPKECGFIPKGTKTLHVKRPDNINADDDNNNNNNNNTACQVEVVEHGCYRSYYKILREPGNGTTWPKVDYYLCEEVREVVVVPVEGCPYGNHVTHTTATSCEATYQADTFGLPHYSDGVDSGSSGDVSGSGGCALYVHPDTTTTTTAMAEDQGTTTEEVLMGSGEQI